MIRARSHYPSDVVAGGVLAVAVAAVAWKLWPTHRSSAREQGQKAPQGTQPGTATTNGPGVVQQPQAREAPPAIVNRVSSGT